MLFKDLTTEDKRGIFSNIDKYLSEFEQKWVKYLDLGCKIIRLVSYTDELLPAVEKQLTYVLRDSAPHYDATLHVWKEKDAETLSKNLHPMFSPATNIYLRLNKIRGIKNINHVVFDNEFSPNKPLIDLQIERGFVMANDYETNNYYYGVNDFSPEEFIKEGHIFVQFINNIIKTPSSNLAHGAVIGLNGNGILICARGQRGKSTLSVLSMMRGFEYVSDDYLILHNNENGELLSSPIYSIITLSPEMYNRLYDDMKGSQFVSNNARKDKYVFNISNFHPQFKKNYPIKICMFPEIVSDPEPSIRLCTKEEKGRAITHLIQSTLMQVQDLCEQQTIKKMYEMVKNFTFYKFCLCHNIEKNTEFLREFMNNLDKQPREILEDDRIFLDITYDLANIIDTHTGKIYAMNKFATNVFENLLRGVSVSELRHMMVKFSEFNPKINEQFDNFINGINELEIAQFSENGALPQINEEFVKENNYTMSFVEFSNKGITELTYTKEKDKDGELCIK